MRAARATWAAEGSAFLVTFRRSRLVARAEGGSSRAAESGNRSVVPRLHLAGFGSARAPAWQLGLELWAGLARELAAGAAAGNVSASAVGAPLHRCTWLMHADGRSYVNVERIAARLSCLGSMRPEYYALAPMTNTEQVALADEAGGYVLGRRLLAELGAATWAEECRARLAGSRAGGFGWEHRPGLFVTLCLWLLRRLRPQRLGDPGQEVLLELGPGAPSAAARWRKLAPTGHCALLVACRGPKALGALHAGFRQGINALQVGCWASSLVEPGESAPPWSLRVARALGRCPLQRALRREDPQASFGRLLAELRSPSRPAGAAADRLRRRGGRRRELCLLLPASGATARQVQRAQAAAATWAQPYLHTAALPPWRDRVVALLYSRRPLLPSWAAATLSLPGDVDLRHPKFNALRFLYMWLTLSTHYTSHCDFFMKADLDAYVDVPRMRFVLRGLNASAPLYLGRVTLAHGPGYESWEAFAHGLGYVLSRGALLAARGALANCLAHVARHRLESIEDMTLAGCLRRAGVRASELAGPVVFDFRGDVARVAAAPQPPLLVHPVEPADMLRLHSALGPSAGRRAPPAR